MRPESDQDRRWRRPASFRWACPLSAAPLLRRRRNDGTENEKKRSSVALSGTDKTKAPDRFGGFCRSGRNRISHSRDDAFSGFFDARRISFIYMKLREWAGTAPKGRKRKRPPQRLRRPEIFGAPGRNRTLDQELRRLLLYPTELRTQRVSYKLSGVRGQAEKAFSSRRRPPKRPDSAACFPCFCL